MARKAILIVACALVFAGTWWVLKPEPRLDLSKEDEPFRSMVLPPKSVAGYMIMDGGSVVMDLIDKTGSSYKFHFYIDKERVINSHPTADYSTKVDWRGIPLKDPARAKRIAIRLLEEYEPEHDEWTALALNGLSDPVGDIAERLHLKTKSLFHEWTGF